MRMPRLKTPEVDAFYHLRSHVAGPPDWFPLQIPEVQEKFMQLLLKFLQAYCCELFSFVLMGNHYHLVLLVQAYRKLSRRELRRRAHLLFSSKKRWPRTKRQWKQFNRRLFDLSEFMKSLNQALAEWYNQNYDRQGPLMAGRFRSTLLTDLQAVLDCMIYVDLNPVRAGLVQRPEQWKYASAALRIQGEDQWLIPLQKVLPELQQASRRNEYKCRLYWRGAVATRDNQAVIPQAIVQAETARGFEQAGTYLKKQRAFSRGGVVGQAPVIRSWIRKLQDQGLYRRKRRPVVHLGGLFYSLIAPRPTRFEFWPHAISGG